MPYTSVKNAKDRGFPTHADNAPLSLAQINKLASLYDGIRASGKAQNPMAVAWSMWKKIYIKDGNRWKKREKETNMAKKAGDKLKVGEFDATKNDDGTYTIHEVPIFATVKKDGKEYNDSWLQEAVSNFDAQKSKSGYLPSIIIGHSKEGEEKESVGLLDSLKKKGKTLCADLSRIGQEMFDKLKGGSFPGRSVETWFSQKRITALALLGSSTPVHKFKPLHVFDEAPDTELDWVHFADPRDQPIDLSETLTARMDRRQKEEQVRDAQWEAESMISRVMRNRTVTMEQKKNYITSVLDQLSSILNQAVDDKTLEEEDSSIAEEVSEMEGQTQDDKKVELFSDEQRTAMDAIVTERVNAAMDGWKSEKADFEQKVTDLDAQIKEKEKEAKEAKDALAEREKADRIASITSFTESLRNGTDGMISADGTIHYGLNAGFLDESGIQAFMESLQEIEGKQKFSDKHTDERTMLDQFQSMTSELVKLAASGKLLVPKGETMPGSEQDRPGERGSSDTPTERRKTQEFSEESQDIDAKIQALATERKIDLEDDLQHHGATKYQELFKEVMQAEMESA